MTWVTWEQEMRQKLRKGVQYLTNEKDTIRLENLDATTLSAIILNKKAQPEDETMRWVMHDKSDSNRVDLSLIFCLFRHPGW